jgi:hypothetical protein
MQSVSPVLTVREMLVHDVIIMNCDVVHKLGRVHDYILRADYDASVPILEAMRELNHINAHLQICESYFEGM